MIAVSLALVASYWNSLFTLPWIWVAPEDSYGYIIPLLALLLLWYRGAASRPFEWGYSEKAAAVFLAAGGLLLLTTVLFDLTVTQMSVVSLWGTMLAIVGGLLFVRPSWPPAVVPRPDWRGVAAWSWPAASACGGLALVGHARILLVHHGRGGCDAAGGEGISRLRWGCGRPWCCC